jgi:hypothetical protein
VLFSPLRSPPRALAVLDSSSSTSARPSAKDRGAATVRKRVCRPHHRRDGQPRAVRGSSGRRRADGKPHSTQRAAMLRRTASYFSRHHLALLALFVALGGTSFAAGNALLPRNSVGTKQVVNGSLQTSDLSKTARAVLKGSRGARGPAGPPGGQARPARRGPRVRKVRRDLRVSRRPSSLSRWMPEARSRTAAQHWRLERTPAFIASPLTPTSRTVPTSRPAARTTQVASSRTTTSTRAAPVRTRSTSRSSTRRTTHSIGRSISRSSADRAKRARPAHE